MALKIYSQAHPSYAFSTNGSLSNPFQIACDGITGNTIYRRLYVRNDNVAKYYTSITVQPILLSGDDVINGTNGYGWKLIAGDTQPLEAQWDLVDWANSITIPNIGSAVAGDISTYEPFWVRITVPKGATVKNYTGITPRLTYTENTV